MRAVARDLGPVAPNPEIAERRIVFYGIKRLARQAVEDCQELWCLKRMSATTVVADRLVGRLEVCVADENRVFRLEELHLVWRSPHARVRKHPSRSVHRSRRGADDHLGLAIAVEVRDNERLIVRTRVEVEAHVDAPETLAVELQTVEPGAPRIAADVVARSV